MLIGIDACVLQYGSVAGSLAAVGCVVLQDNLCKAVEVLQTTTTALFG